MNEDVKMFYNSLFLTLVYNFQSSAMIGMGKVLNPIKNEITRNMNEAKFSIDMLGMLSELTKGNLPEETNKMLQRILTELRLNYVDEVTKDKKAEAEEEKSSEEEKIEDKKEEAPAEGEEKKEKKKPQAKKKKKSVKADKK